MEIKIREELIKYWKYVKDDKNEDKKPDEIIKKIKEYLKCIENKELQKELESAISSISKIDIDPEFKKISKFDEILKCVQDFKLPFIEESDNFDYLFIVLELVHNKLITYSDVEIDNILKVYETIFKTKDDDKGNELKKDLIEYLDLEKERGYSVITSNFLDDEAKDNLINANKEYEKKLLEISKGLADLDKERKKLVKKEEKFFKDHFKDDLFTKSKRYKIGSSIGIDPLTDDLLLRSFESGKEKDVIIILGKDSYPCFHLDKNKLYHYFQPPLQNYSMYNHNSFYKLFGTIKNNRFEVDLIINNLMKEHIFLFLNLYPDFRPELQPTSGNFKPDWGGGLAKCFDYCAEKFESVIQIIQNNNITIKAIISLGGDVKYSLVRNKKIYNNDGSPLPENENVELKKIEVLRYKDKSKNIDINYIPIYHPTAREFNWKYKDTEKPNDDKTYNDKYFEILGKVLNVDSSSQLNPENDLG